LKVSNIEEIMMKSSCDVWRFILDKIYAEVEIINNGRDYITKRKRGSNTASDLEKECFTTIALWYWVALIREVTRTLIIMSVERTVIV